MTSPRHVALRASWGVADQVLSSLINFALGIAIARVGTPTEFGAYGLVFAAYLIAINITRPLAIEPLIIRFTGVQPSKWHASVGAATAIVLMAGVAMGLVGVAGGLVAGGFPGLAFVIVGVGLPGLVLQDAWRLAFFAEARGSAAFLNDLVWAVVFGSALAWIAVSGTTSPAYVLLAWVIGAACAALLGLIQAGAAAWPRWSRRWWQDQRDLARPLLVEHVATNVINELTPYAIGAIAGLSSVAALRAAQLLLGPFNLIFQALGLVALPEAVRIASRSRRRLVQVAIAFSAAMSVMVLIVGLFILTLPDEVGVRLLGETWPLADSVMLPYTLVLTAGMISAGSIVGLRALGEGRETLRVGVIRSALASVGAIVGAFAGGAPSAALGMALGHAIGGVETWRAFLIASVRPGSRPNEPLSQPTITRDVVGG